MDSFYLRRKSEAAWMSGWQEAPAELETVFDRNFNQKACKTVAKSARHDLGV